jgi:hypothetical protein
MAFETLSPRLQFIAQSSLTYCRKNFGKNGISLEKPIAGPIGWQPTFFLRPNRALIVAVEVSDVIFPDILKGAAHDIEHYEYPIAIYQACALDVYQSDNKFVRSKLLRDHGFGLITVDEEGNADFQTVAQPLAQFIPRARFDRECTALTPSLRVRFGQAYTTYQTNVGQGLQEAGQIVEAMVRCIANHAVSAKTIKSRKPNSPVADIIDDLYQAGAYKQYRAALGGARKFIKEYRNMASHPSKTARQAADRIRVCRVGFLDSIEIACALRGVAQAVHCRIEVQ